MLMESFLPTYIASVGSGLLFARPCAKHLIVTTHINLRKTS